MYKICKKSILPTYPIAGTNESLHKIHFLIRLQQRALARWRFQFILNCSTMFAIQDNKLIPLSKYNIYVTNCCWSTHFMFSFLMNIRNWSQEKQLSKQLWVHFFGYDIGAIYISALEWCTLIKPFTLIKLFFLFFFSFWIR